jgi:hypothetical protein
MPASSPANQRIAQEVRTNDSDFSNAQESEGEGDSEPDPAEIDPRELQLHQDKQRGMEITGEKSHSPPQAKQGMRKLKFTKPLSFPRKTKTSAKPTPKNPLTAHMKASLRKIASVPIGASSQKAPSKWAVKEINSTNKDFLSTDPSGSVLTSGLLKDEIITSESYERVNIDAVSTQLRASAAQRLPNPYSIRPLSTEIRGEVNRPQTTISNRSTVTAAETTTLLGTVRSNEPALSTAVSVDLPISERLSDASVHT